MKPKLSLKTDTVKRTEADGRVLPDITSTIRTYEFENGEIERVQSVSGFTWDELSFMRPSFNPDGYKRVVSLYTKFIVPYAPYIFGRLVLFNVPEGYEIPEEVLNYKLPGGIKGTCTADSSKETARRTSSPATAKTLLTAYLSKQIRLDSKGQPHFRNDLSKQIWTDLSEKGCLSVVCGSLPYTKFLQVDSTIGFLTENEPNATLKVNSSFFVMDCFDVGCFSDRIGTPLGLCVKDGKVLNPPLFSREALLVKQDGTIEVRPVELSEMMFSINGVTYASSTSPIFADHKVAGTDVRKTSVFSRPSRFKVLGCGAKYAAIVGTRVDAVYTHGFISVPESGFLLKLPKSAPVVPGDEVVYGGFEGIKFAASVGNSILINDVPTTCFKAKYYNIRRQFGFRSYPPSLYPLNFEGARAPRIALGADAQNQPVILWAEGAGKFGYERGKGSVGASLSEMITYCQDAGMKNAINLDGGGSAQILMNNTRSLEVSDRNKDDFSEVERAVPMGLFVR